jgi:hypothetical protein
MVYNTQSYWVFGLCPSSNILNTRKYEVSETVSVLVLRRRGQTPTLPGPLERLPLHLRTQTDPVSETSCFLDFRIPDDGESPQTQ